MLDTKECSAQWIPLEGYKIKAAATYEGDAVPFVQNEGVFKVDLNGIEKPETDTVIVLTLDRDVERKQAEEVYFTGKE